MPLRFDQPSLLGEWKGDPAIIHQALSQMHSASEGEKNRANTKAIADAELKAKKPSFKIDKVDGSPFSKDQQKMGILINGAMDAINRGENPEPYTEKAQQISNTGKAQKNALDQLKLQTNELQQAYGADVIDTTPVSKEINSAYNDHDDETRGVAIGEAAKHIADPSIGMFKADTFYAKKLLDIKPVEYTYSDKNERGIVNEGTDRKVIGRLVVPDTKRPQYERKNGSLSPVLDANGQPVYEMRNASTIDDIIPMVRATLDNDKNAAQWAVNQTARTEKDEIEKITKNWIDSEVNRPDGGMPDKQTIEAKKQIVARDLTEKKIAKQWLQLDRQGTTTISNTISLDEPRQPTEAQQKKSESKRNLRKIGGSSTNVTGNVLTPSKNVKSEYDSRLGKTSDTNRLNSMLFQKDKNGSFTDIDAQTFSLSGDITDETTGEKFKITENEPAVAKNVYPVLEHYNDKTKKWVRTKFDPNHTDKDFEANINHYGQKGIPVRVSMQGDINISTKQNKTGTMTPEEMQELNTLQNVKERDETQNARLGVLEGKLAKELGRTVRVNMEESGILKQVTGFDNMEEVAKNADTPEIKKIAENNIKWKRLAEAYNSKTRNKVVAKPVVTTPKPEVTRVKEIAVPTNPNIKLSLIDQIKKEMPNATPEQWVSEYKKRSK